MLENDLIMPLEKNLKSKYLEWLQELFDKLSPRQEQLAVAYAKAILNLNNADGVFYHPRDLKSVKGIGDAIIRRLHSKLSAYCAENGYDMPQYTDTVTTDMLNLRKRSSTTLRSTSNGPSLEEVEREHKRKRTTRRYIPRKRSVGYAILLGLLELSAVRAQFTKNEIIAVAQKYTDASLAPNPAAGDPHGAWSGIKTLKNNMLILEEGRPKRFSLTLAGTELAETLKRADNIKFENEEVGGIPKEFSANGRIEEADPEISTNLSALLKTEDFLYDKEVRFPSENYMGSSDASSLVDATFYGDTVIDESIQPSVGISDLHTNGSVEPPSIDRPPSRSRRLKFHGVPYEIWKHGTYEILPVVDRREIRSQKDRDFFFNALRSRGMNAEVRQLALGDIVWVARNKATGFQCVLDTIIERKRLDDLAESIKDNRFMEQKNRLEKSGCKNKYYLIEESLRSSLTGMGEALKTALWVILVYFKFSVIRTSNSEQTVEKLHSIHSVILQHYSKKDLLVVYPPDLVTQDDYRKVLEKFNMEFGREKGIECCHTLECFQDIMGKNDLRTVGELTIQILMYIKGVSVEKAVAIQSIFPTLNDILTAYRNCKSQEEAKMLMFTKLGDAPGNKKMTKLLSERIADVFT